MKKIVFLCSMIVSLVPLSLAADTVEEFERYYTAALSAGYVFKNDCAFKNTYGHGMVDVLTADACYYVWHIAGFGAKVSYWRAHGQTTFFSRCTLLQEVPFTLYARLMKDFDCGLQLYGSLGGGCAWIKEKSYLGQAHLHKGIGEIEVGLFYQLWRYLNFTSSFRYLFPPQKQKCEKIDVGGCDLRAGIGFSF
jgi:hypothetical protein